MQSVEQSRSINPSASSGFEPSKIV